MSQAVSRQLVQCVRDIVEMSLKANEEKHEKVVQCRKVNYPKLPNDQIKSKLMADAAAVQV